jgi:hypothetical protein
MRGLYPVSLACEVLEVSASGYFNWLRRRESGQGGPTRRLSDEALLAHILDFTRFNRHLLSLKLKRTTSRTGLCLRRSTGQDTERLFQHRPPSTNST